MHCEVLSNERREKRKRMDEFPRGRESHCRLPHGTNHFYSGKRSVYFSPGTPVTLSYLHSDDVEWLRRGVMRALNSAPLGVAPEHTYSILPSQSRLCCHKLTIVQASEMCVARYGGGRALRKGRRTRRRRSDRATVG